MKRKQWWILGGGLVVVMAGGLGIASTRDQGIAVQAAPVGRENLQSKVSANGSAPPISARSRRGSLRTPRPGVVRRGYGCRPLLCGV